MLLLVGPAVSGCETLDRMDYLDRFFEPTASRPVSTAATEALRRPEEPSPPPPMDWNPQPVSVVAMEPIESPEDRWTTGERHPQQAAARATPPRPEVGAPPAAADPEARTRSLVRQNPWLTRFWMELTPAQRARVERGLHRGTGDVRLASEGQAEPPAAAWDRMGLSDRANLVFGRGASPGRSAPPVEDRGASPSAEDS